jgi:hypothetical protein
MKRTHHWKTAVAIFSLWALLAIPALAHSAPIPAMTAAPTATTTMAPVAARPAPVRAAPRPVAKPVAKPVARPAARPATRPAVVPPAMVTSEPMDPPMAATPTTVPPAAMAVEQPTMAATPADATPNKDKKDSKGSVIGGFLLQLLLGVLAVAVPIILTPVVKWLLKKMKVEDAKTQQMIDDMVDKAVVMGLNYAEEQAHKLRDNPVKSAEKLNMAADKALDYLKDSKVVDKGAEYIKSLIEAKLGEKRDTATKPKVAPAKTEEKEEKEEKEDEDKKSDK